MMKKKLVILILNWTIIFTAGAFCISGQEKEPDLKDKRIAIKMENQPLGKVFEHLIVNYDIAIGFEESALDREHNDYEFETNLPYNNDKKIVSSDGNMKISVVKQRVFPVKQHWFTVNAENKRLEDVLNVIVGQMQNYKWEINDEVVNIFPVRGRDKKYEELLALNIQSFNLEIENYNSKKGKPIFLIRTKIFKLPEIQKFLGENRIFYNKGYRESLDNLDRRIPDILNFSNLSLRDLLNKITKIKRGGWILKKSDMYNSKDEESVEINI
jgi:hypothetical protein